MSLTVDNIITEALEDISRSASGTTRAGRTLETKSIGLVYRACIRMARMHTFDDLLDTSSSVAGESITVADTETYDFPTNWKTIISIKIINGSSSRKLSFTQRRRMDEIIPYPENDSTRIPYLYTPFGNSFDVYPIPDDAYVMPIRYAKWPTKPTATTDTLEYSDQLEDVLVKGTLVELYDYLGQYTDKAVFDQEFIDRMKMAVAAEEDTPDYDPTARGFRSDEGTYMGEYWNDPFIGMYNYRS